jgi:hypothetical protein
LEAFAKLILSRNLSRQRRETEDNISILNFFIGWNAIETGGNNTVSNHVFITFWFIKNGSSLVSSLKPMDLLHLSIFKKLSDYAEIIDHHLCHDFIQLWLICPGGPEKRLSRYEFRAELA